MSGTAHNGGIAIIADDEEVGRLLLAESAAAAGLAPVSVDNGAAAVEAALAAEVALVLLDVEMPQMDGYAACRRLREEPRFANVPIVMVTGHEDSVAIDRAFEAGATDFVSKPVNWALLPRRLEYILRNAAAARDLTEHVTQVRTLVDALERLAYFDPLTGLPNRQRCIEAAEALFRDAATGGEQVAVIYLDLNSFKRINDAFGHAVGDAVLRTVAQRLSRTLEALRIESQPVSVCRFGGDEFVILLHAPQVRAAAIQAAEECRAAFGEAILYEGLEFYPAPSIGLAVFPDDGADVESVFKHADTAMYHAKAGGTSNIAVYTSAMSSRLHQWLDLEARLRHAVRDDLLHLQFQPKLRLRDQTLVGVEALLRWCDAEHGEIPPTRFVEIAEDSGLIIELGRWAMHAACRQLRGWIDRGIAVPVAVNVSGKQLLHGDTARMLEEEAAAAGVPPAMIEIEITESLLVSNCGAVRDALDRLRALGCRIALDDFGTGYSSLAYITRFPPDRIKIDKAFVSNVDRSVRDAAVANSILALADSLGIVVTAEGIERPAQLQWLRARGCHEGQGFLLARPLSAGELEEKFLSGSRCCSAMQEPAAGHERSVRRALAARS